MTKKELISVDRKIIGIEGRNIGDFWSWSYSDLFSNTVRPMFAEYIVGYALGILEAPRVEWIAYDFLYKGKKVEVKSSGYLQSEPQKKLSTIRFDIGMKKQAWDPETSAFVNLTARSADCYVFALHAAVDESTADVLDLRQWCFFVLPAKDIEKHFGSQKSVALSRIEKVCSAVSYDRLKKTIDTNLGLH